MPTALLVTADLGGNIPPLFGIASELRHRGWTVHVHGDARLRSRAETAGFSFTEGSGPAYDPLAAMSTPAGLRAVSRFFGDRSRGRDAVELARRIDADVALVDTLLAGVVAECTAAGVPTVVLGHTIWHYIERVYARSPIALLMRLHGVDLLRTLRAADAMIIPTDPRLDGAGALPPNAVRTGPVLQETPRREERGPRARVLVSLSTNWFPGQDAVLQRVLDAVEPLPVDVVVTAGRASDIGRLRVPANAEVHRMLDHAAVLPGVDVLIGHGGHATTVRALAHGVPILVVPVFSMIDQPAIGRAVQRIGAGLTLPGRAKPDRIRKAVVRLLHEPRFRRTAEAIGNDLARGVGASAAADEIARVAASRARTAA